MTAISYTIIIIFLFIKQLLAEGLLISDEFRLTMTASSITGWPQVAISCTSTDYVQRDTQKFFGIIDKNNNSNIKKTYTINQPHWSISVRVNLYMLKSFSASDKVQIYMNGAMQREYQRGTNTAIGKALCLTTNDYLYQFYSNITHSGSTFDLEFKSTLTTSASTGGYALSELFITIDTCYPGCLTCSGPAMDQCLSCITGATPSGSQCKCSTGFAYQNSCIGSCPAGYRGEPTLLVCVKDECNTSNCQICDNTNQVCTQCKTGFYLLGTVCVTSCPTYTTLVGNNCQDTLPSNGSYLLKALFENYVGESEITAAGLSVTGFEGNGYGTLTSSGALNSVCNGVYYVGGFMLAASGGSFKRTFSGLPPHSQIRVGFTFVAIDEWRSEYMYIMYDGVQASKYMVDFDLTNDDLCGLSEFKDLVFIVDKTAVHTATTLNLEIHGVISKDSSKKSYGLRNLFVIILQCSQWCISCDPSKCLQCDITHYLYKGSCYVTCPIATYIDLARECHDCHISCATCSGPNSTDCITCPPGKLLYNNGGWTCVSSCPTTNYYSDGTKCQQCDSSCLTCSGGANNNCLTCNTGSFLYHNQCFGTCPLATYPSGSNCADCNSNCKTCAGPSDKECTSCNTTKYLLTTASSKECVTECGNLLYEDTSNNQCSSCDNSCYNCTGPNIDQCTQCTGSRYLQGTRCVTTCNTGFYPGASNTCTPCDPSCTTCNGGASTNCLSCTLSLYLNGNKCVSNCDSNQYKVDSNATCASCDASCLTCSGSGINNCTSCAPSFFLHVDGSCVSKCPNGYYADGNVCKKCPTQCTTCILQGGSPVCASCPSNQALSNGSCVASCPAKTYQSNNGSTNICLNCDISCQTCSGPGSTECLSCVLPNYFYPDTLECKPSCKAKYYPVNATATCSPCNSTCYQCSGPTTNECTACDGSLYLQNNTCTSTCQSGKYANSTNHKCDPCDSTCLTCSAGTATDCLSCSSPNLLQTEKNSCLPTCKANEFQDKVANKCVVCNPACVSCSGPGSDQCLGCQTGQFLYTSPDNKKTCTATCPDGYFADTVNNICTQCSTDCLTCTAPGDNQSCLTCDSTKFLLDGKCVASCPQKYYPSSSPTTKICSKCYQDCLTCTGPTSTECNTCQLPLYFVAATSECKSTCPTQFYKNDALAQCSSCNSTCATCNGPSSNQCLTCTGSLYLDGTSCMATCSPQKFPNSADNTCSLCDSTCKTCNGTTDSSCLSCALPRYYQSSIKKCVISCNSNQFKDDTSITCKPCHSTCATCTGPNANECTSCNGTDVLFNGNTCKSNCPDGSYQDAAVCKPCSATCKTCIYPGEPTKCVTCDTSKFLYKNQCLGACPDKTFISTLPDNTKICDDCDSSCKSCNGSLINNCTACVLPLYLNSDSTCKATCEVKEYKNDSNATCSACHSDCFYCTGPNNNQCTACTGTKFLDTASQMCVTVCPAKQYPNTTNNTCSDCHSSCKSCDGPLATNCIACDLPNYMQTTSKECKTTCQLSEYKDNTTVSCKACQASCKTCTDYGTNKCISCNGTDLLYQGNSCVSTCPNGYYKNVNVCSLCSSSCKTCNYPGDNTTCTSCNTSQYLYNGQCIPSCPAKTYPQTSPSGNTCQPCNSTCQTCNGSQPNQCLTCISPLYYNPNNKLCQSTCDDKFYKNDSNSTCSPCDSSCQNCTGLSPNQCTACAGTKYLNGTICSDDCPSGFFKNNTNNVCTQCHPTCKTCSTNSSTDCITCATLYFLQTQTNECKTTCNINEYIDSVSQKCIVCNSTCKTCNGSGTSSCLSCNGTDLLINGNSCIISCPDGYYQDVNSCKQCDSTCKRCKNPGDNKSCTACASDKYLLNGSCIATCPNHYFVVKNLDTNVCTQCDSSCNTCTGPTQNDCQTCKLPNYLNENTHTCSTTCDQRYYQNTQFAICSKCNDSCFECTAGLATNCKSCVGTKFLDVNQCVDNCPIGKFKRVSDNLCALCHPSCKTCNGTASTNCLSCNLPTYLQPATNECVNSCYPSQFKYDTTATCASCNSSCNTCKGPDSNQCTSCKGNDLLNVDNTCVGSCADGFYQDGQNCKKCSFECLTCGYPGTNKNCLSCTTDKFLYKGGCVSKCPLKSYVTIIQGVKTCIDCDNSCLTCNGSSNMNCSSCALPNYFVASSGQCLSICPDGFYKNDKLVECSSCDSTCFKCNGPATNSCTSCSGGRYLDNQKCSIDCSIGKYKSPTDNVCLDCNKNCKTCSVTNPNSCESCSLPNYYQYRDKSCQLICQSDQYRDDASVSCINCHPSCTTCLGNKETDCLSCTGSYLENGKCVSSCSDGYYANTQRNRCEKCHRNCQTCFGPDQNNCQSCITPFFYQRSTFQCISKCDKNQYAADSTHTCESCHPDCATCSGPLNNQCNSCSGSLNLYQNTCLSSCPDSYYADQNICKICTEGCLICTSGGVNRCQTCMNTYFLHQGKCLKKCPEFFFEDDYANRCEPCSSNCSQCVNYGSLTCQKCGNGFQLYNNACIQKCPVGTYNQNQACFNCNIACLSCSGPSDNQCLSCQSNMYLQDNYCTTQCDTNYALIPNTQLCMKCDSSCETCSGPQKDQCLTCLQNFIPFGTQCLSECPENFYRVAGELKCASCKSYCGKCSNNTDCQACSKGYVMFNGECLSSCPNHEYFIDSATNQCTLCHEECKDSGCFGPSENECIVNYIEAKESILFIIFMAKLGYWIFSCISGYFMDKFDDNQHSNKVSLFMQGNQQQNLVKQTSITSQTQDQSLVKRRNRNKFGEEMNQTQLDLNNNNNTQNNQTLQNISLNTSSYNQQINNPRVLNSSQINSQMQMSPVKNQSQPSWRQSPYEMSPVKAFKTPTDMSPMKNSYNQPSWIGADQNEQNNTSNYATHRPVIIKRFSFKQDDGGATFRDQDDQKSSEPQTTNNQTQLVIQPIEMPYDQKLYYSLIGNDLIQVWTLYNPFLSRIYRATIVYFKFLCFFFATEQVYKKSPGLLIISLILGMIIKEILFIFFIQFAICMRKSAMIAVFLLVTAVIIHITVWFRPEVQTLTSHKDITWSWMYLTVFLVDFIFLQTMIALARYVASVRHLEKRRDKTQALLDKTLVDQGVVYKICNAQN